MICLCSCVVNGSVSDAERVGNMDNAALYRAAEQHMLAVTSAVALELAGVKDLSFSVALAMAIRKTVIVEAEMAALPSRLEAAGILVYAAEKGATEGSVPNL